MVALQFIKAHLPELQIDWLVETRFADLLRDNPDISNILTVNLKATKINKRAIFHEIKTVRNYARERYDLVIDAQGLLKSAIAAKLLGKYVAGFDKNSIRESLASLFYSQKSSVLTMKIPLIETRRFYRNRSDFQSHPLTF